MGKKRGQITIFVILGIVLLLTLAYIVFFRQEGVLRPDQIDQEFIPVKDYVETCMRTIAYDGINMLGFNGGYIEIPVSMKNNPYMTLNPTGAPGSPFQNPYWWYNGISAIPTEDYMEAQVEDHIRNGIADCLQSFEAFKDSYNFKILGDFEVSVEFGKSINSLVEIESVYPFEISDKFNKTLGELKDFRATVPIRMHRTYEVAKQLMDFENEDPFVERKVIDLIALTPEDVMPLTGFELACGKKTWSVPKIKEHLQRLIRTNLGYVKVANTKYNKDRYIPVPNQFSSIDSYNSSYYASHYIWEVPNMDRNMRIGFRYDDRWGMDLKIRPSDGVILESNSQSGQEMLAFLCMRLWHFTYDIIFPVTINVVDEQTDQHDSFSFNFAFMASIDHNMPARRSFAFESFDTKRAVPNEEYCNELRYIQNIVAVEDVENGEEITDVNVTFKCGNFRCELGKTEPHYDSGIMGTPMYRNRTPYCVNAVVEMNKEGYTTGKGFVTTNFDGQLHEIKMSPLKYFTNYTVVKHKYTKDQVFPEQKLEDGETAAIVIKYGEKDFQSFAQYPTDIEYPLKLLSRDDFDFEVQIFIMKNDSFIGGYMGNWSVSAHNLEVADQAKFHVLYMDTEDEDEAYAFVSGLKTYSKEVPQPELKLI